MARCHVGRSLGHQVVDKFVPTLDGGTVGAIAGVVAELVNVGYEEFHVFPDVGRPAGVNLRLHVAAVQLDEVEDDLVVVQLIGGAPGTVDPRLLPVYAGHGTLHPHTDAVSLFLGHHDVQGELEVGMLLTRRVPHHGLEIIPRQWPFLPGTERLRGTS